jgi:hypothetical protein
MEDKLKVKAKSRTRHNIKKSVDKSIKSKSIKCKVDEEKIEKKKSVRKSRKKSVRKQDKNEIVDGINKTLLLDYNYNPLNEDEEERKTSLKNCFIVYGASELYEELKKLLEKNKNNLVLKKHLQNDLKWIKSNYKKFFPKKEKIEKNKIV